MEGNIFNTTCTKYIFDNPNKHIHPPTPRVVTPTCSPVSTPTSDGHDVQLGNNIDNKFGMLQSGHTINGINTMHHRTDHNNINNNDTNDTDGEQIGMNSSIKYIKSTKNCTGNNPWANDTKDDVQEGIVHNKLNGYESANHLPLQEGDDVPVTAPEWIIYIMGITDDDEDVIAQWLLLNPPSLVTSEMFARHSLMSYAQALSDDLHKRINEGLLLSLERRTDTQHSKRMCNMLLSNQQHINNINYFVAANWNNKLCIDTRMEKERRITGRVAKLYNHYTEPLRIVETVANEHVENSESEEFVPSSELEEYTTSPISTQHKVCEYSKKVHKSTLPNISELEEYAPSTVIHYKYYKQPTLHIPSGVIQTNDTNESVMFGNRNGGHALPLNDTNNGETAGYDPKTIAMIDQWMMLEMAHEEMVEEIGIPRTARLMVLLRCYKCRRKSTINLRLEQLRLDTSIYDENRKRVWVKVETCRQTDGERHRPLIGITRVTSKCNQRRMISSLAEILLEEIASRLRKKGLGC